MTLYRHVDVSQVGDVNVVCLLDREIRGEAASNDLEPELTRLASPDGFPKVLLDLGQVEFVTSSAIVQLIMLKNSLTASGARLILCSLRPEVYDVFSMMKLDTLFQIEEDRVTALDAFNRPPPLPPAIEDDGIDAQVLGTADDVFVGDEAASSSAKF